MKIFTEDAGDAETFGASESLPGGLGRVDS